MRHDSLPVKLKFFLLERHLVAVVAISEGWLPRFYPGWSRLRHSSLGCDGREPLPQRTNFLADKVALRTMTRYSAEVIFAAKAESRLKAFPTKTMLHWL